ncbi:uncharacterized protein LOC114362069 [Ostrinia furnacalis]|uniref:uncharacterized protein LOC114362069 n=1 Tax=Ostrinia furnacalis TaxID=93504 RepID=UPI00103CFB3F|nr:uncharacterized protein LOC114362069 [Ostrinia furnacalis]
MNNFFGLLICLHVLISFEIFSAGAVYYAVEFADSIISCPDFDNPNIKADIELGLQAGEDGTPDTFGLDGVLDLIIELDDDHTIELEVCKETEVACEPMLAAQVGMCDSMKDSDAPWFPLFTMMNISSCPIPVGQYPIKNLHLSVEQFKGCLSRDFCGFYSAKINILKKLDVVACYMVYLEVVEKQDD